MNNLHTHECNINTTHRKTHQQLAANQHIMGHNCINTQTQPKPKSNSKQNKTIYRHSEAITTSQTYENHTHYNPSIIKSLNLQQAPTSP
eukprot:gene3220-2202_t